MWLGPSASVFRGLLMVSIMFMGVRLEDKISSLFRMSIDLAPLFGSAHACVCARANTHACTRTHTHTQSDSRLVLCVVRFRKPKRSLSVNPASQAPWSSAWRLGFQPRRCTPLQKTVRWWAMSHCSNPPPPTAAASCSTVLVGAWQCSSLNPPIPVDKCSTDQPPLQVMCTMLFVRLIIMTAVMVLISEYVFNGLSWNVIEMRCDHTEYPLYPSLFFSVSFSISFFVLPSLPLPSVSFSSFGSCKWKEQNKTKKLFSLFHIIFESVDTRVGCSE